MRGALYESFGSKLSVQELPDPEPTAGGQVNSVAPGDRVTLPFVCGCERVDLARGAELLPRMDRFEGTGVTVIDRFH